MAAEESAARYKQAQGTAKSTAGNEKAAKADQAKGDGAKQKALLKHLKEAKASAHKLGVINKASTKAANTIELKCVSLKGVWQKSKETASKQGSKCAGMAEKVGKSRSRERGAKLRKR